MESMVGGFILGFVGAIIFDGGVKNPKWWAFVIGVPVSILLFTGEIAF